MIASADEAGLLFPRGLAVALGLTAQVLFFTRTASQWLLSERAGRCLVPRSFWWLSVTGAALLLAYAADTGDPIFVAGPLVSLAIFGRNLRLARPRVERGLPLLALLPLAVLAATAFGAVAVSKLAGEFAAASQTWTWIAVGVLGQTIWSARYTVQWWASERRGQSLLPAAFWWVSLFGAALLLVYAIHRVDWVFILGYSLNPIPYLRNLVLLSRGRSAQPDPVGS